MSKPAGKFLHLKLMCSFIAFATLAVSAQDLKATITIDKDRSIALVSGEFSADRDGRNAPVTNLSFRQQAIGIQRLAARVSKIELLGAEREILSYRRLQGSEVVLDPGKNSDAARISRFSYEVDVRPATDRRAAAHASWVTPESGLLFFDDLLPLRSSASPRAVFIKLELPTGWGSASTLNNVHGTAMLWNVPDEVALIGPQIRERSDEGTTIVTLDTWQFSDEKALTTATEVAEAYQKIFTKYPSTRRHILLVRFPQQNVPKGTWEAETRGTTVVLVSSDMAFESQAVQRLSEQLRHETFHWWIPNALNLTGNYDWFYEGFALYTSLKTGVALNQITFADFLDTLSRAHTIDNASSAGRLSLIEASAARWAGHETQVYARGMVVAFLCDLTLLRDSKGKRSVEALLRQLYVSRRHDAAAEDGNTAVLRVLESEPGLQTIAKAHIRGNARVDWGPVIAAAGLEMEPGVNVTRLRVASQLQSPQKTLLDKLGYNSWRKLTRK